MEREKKESVDVPPSDAAEAMKNYMKENTYEKSKNNLSDKFVLYYYTSKQVWLLLSSLGLTVALQVENHWFYTSPLEH